MRATSRLESEPFATLEKTFFYQPLILVRISICKCQISPWKVAIEFFCFLMVFTVRLLNQRLFRHHGPIKELMILLNRCVPFFFRRDLLMMLQHFVRKLQLSNSVLHGWLKNKYEKALTG